MKTVGIEPFSGFRPPDVPLCRLRIESCHEKDSCLQERLDF